MGFNSAQVSIPTTAGGTQLIVQGTAAGQFRNVSGSPTDPLPCTLRNLDATNPVYLGQTGTVAAGTGYPLKAGEALPITFIANDAIGLFAIATGATVVIAILMGRQ